MFLLIFSAFGQWWHGLNSLLVSMTFQLCEYKCLLIYCPHSVFPGAVLIYWVKLYILCFSSGNRKYMQFEPFLGIQSQGLYRRSQKAQINPRLVACQSREKTSLFICLKNSFTGYNSHTMYLTHCFLVFKTVSQGPLVYFFRYSLPPFLINRLIGLRCTREGQTKYRGQI